MPVFQNDEVVEFLFEEEDLPYEEEILRNPYSVKHWLRYIEHKRESPSHVVNLLYERALKELPGSYKLWYAYLRLRRRQVRARCVTDPSFEHANNAHERALVFMNKMPRLWLDYCTFLMEQGLVTRTRRTFDRALRALPVTQHSRVWPLYLKFVRAQAPEETAARVYRRYMQVAPEQAEEFVQFLVSAGKLDEASQKLAEIINDENFSSKEGKSKHQLWNELCDLLSRHPDQVHTLKVEPIIRQGILKYRDQVGLLWCSLADYYIRSANFERARDVYEEAIQTVMTVRDFTQVFDAYAQFEEGVISSKMEVDAPSNDEDDVDLELRLARLEDIMERRPLLLNSVLLRQNPHNVHEWHKRVQLYRGKPGEKRQIVSTYTEAVQTVDAKVALGKPHTLWVAFAKYYEENQQVSDAHTIFEKAVQVQYKTVDDLAAVWCEWTELYIRHEKYDSALKLLQKAVIPPGRPVDYFDQNETVQDRVHKSLKLWSLYADLEESFGTYQSCKAVYDRIIDLRIATPQIVINYGMFLEENKYFEEAFKAYEKGIALFKWPNVYDIWNTYLNKFIHRYGGKKLERARDLFEQCLDGCPEKFAKNLYLLYAKLEEEHGLARHAMRVYDRSTRAVPTEQQHEMFNIYIKRAAELYGVTYTRDIYQKAIDTLPEEKAREMCMRFAELERKLGEVDRARAIYVHASEICDPRSMPEFWETWKQFEVAHGNEDTVREMLRNKRKVQAIFNTQVNFMASKAISNSQSVQEAHDAQVQEGGSGTAAEGVTELEARARQLAEQAVQEKQPEKGILFVRSSAPAEDGGNEVRAANPEEIDIGESSDEEEKQVQEVEKQHVPDAVFGSLQRPDEATDSD